MPIIKACKLNKSFKGEAVLKNISFELENNQIFGLIGPDGAGKSTLFRILCTLILADSGKASIKGLDIEKDYKQIRAFLGYMPGNFSLYMDLSVRENLEFFAKIYNQNLRANFKLIEPIYEALAPFETRKARALSGGMKQKLALCCTLIHKPSLLFLDEPTTGVDAVSRKEFWDILQILKEQMSIIVSTPYMDEASRCDKIALMNKGEILRISGVKELCASFSKKLYAFYGIKGVYTSELARLDMVDSCYLFGQCSHITLKENARLEDLLALLHTQFGTQIKCEHIEAGVEDCFMELVR